MNTAGSFNLEPGDTVGGYTLVSRLGSGAMGSVWRVEDGGGTEYAMKILLDSLVEDEDTADPTAVRAKNTARERLRREAMALRKIDDPGVCSIVDMEFDDSFAFIVTELIEGKNLRDDVRQNGRYVGDDLERLASKMMQAVQAVHNAGIVHRDIKPTNVMISNMGPVLVDFGIAMEEGDIHVTSTGMVMGTPGFIAPEVVRGEESNEVTDWWSTAAVLAFAATGAPVFGTQPMMAVLEREASGNANLQGLPPRTLQAFRSALDPNPAKRCSPQELLDAISADAWNAESWDGNGEVMPPFDGDDPATRVIATAKPDPNNPRTLWRERDGATQVIPQSKITQDKPGHTRALPLVGANPVDLNSADGERTRVLPTEAGQSETQALPKEDAGTQTASAVPYRAPGDTRIAKNLIPPPPRTETPAEGQAESTETAQATSVMPQGNLGTRTVVSNSSHNELAQKSPTEPERTSVMQQMPPAVQPAPEQMPQSFVPQAATETPLAPSVNPSQPQPVEQLYGGDPASVHKAQEEQILSRYARGGILPGILFALPLGILAMSMPLVAWILGCLSLWVFTAFALNVCAQIDRQVERGGAHKGTDTALRALSMPWHLVKGLFLAIPRALLFTAVYLVIVVVVALVGQLPLQSYPFDFGSLQFELPVLWGVPLDATSWSLGIAIAVAWVIILFAQSRPLVRIAFAQIAGTGRGKHGKSQAEQMGVNGMSGYPGPYSQSGQMEIDAPPKGHARLIVVTVVWALLCACAVVAMFLVAQISWIPLV